MVMFFWWCFCGDVFVVVFLWWCGVVLEWYWSGVFVVMFFWWCFCGVV